MKVSNSLILMFQEEVMLKRRLPNKKHFLNYSVVINAATDL